MTSSGVPLSRREEYAQTTRRAVVDAARRLFASRGYFATKVDEIAAEARVSPATVYAVCGGKQGLLQELIVLWVTDPVVNATIDAISASTDSASIVSQVASVSRQMREDFADIMRVVLSTAPHDPVVAAQLAEATRVYRDAFVPIATHLSEIGALKLSVDVNRAVDIFWFYFGYSSYFTLHDDNGWTYEEAESWLAAQASRELLVSCPGDSLNESSD